MHGGSCLFVRDGVKVVENLELVKLATQLFCEISAVDLIGYNITVVGVYRTNLVSATI